jgi:hypothetical protein
VYPAGQLVEAATENPDKALGTVAGLIRVLAFSGKRDELVQIRSLMDRLLADDLD